MALGRAPYTPTYHQVNVRNFSIIKAISFIFWQLFAKSTSRDRVIFIKFLIHNLELSRNSTICWGNPRIYSPRARGDNLGDKVFDGNRKVISLIADCMFKKYIVAFLFDAHIFHLFVCVEVLRPCQQLRSCRVGQLPINTVPGQA